jgi:hypothetical protein
VFRDRLLFVLLFITLTGVVPAGENVWTTNGPAASVGALAIDPMTGMLYASARVFPDRDAVFRSSDHGQSWDFLIEVPLYSSVSTLAVDPKDSSVYATVNYGPYGGRVYRSSDSGVTWIGLASLDRRNVWSFAFPVQIGPLYAGGSMCVCQGFPCFYRTVCQAALLRSDDSGSSWNLVGGPLAGGRLSSLVHDPLNSNRFYAAGDGGMFVSSDEGGSWTSPTAGAGGCLSIALAIDPRDSAVVFAGARQGTGDYCGGLYKSEDGGRSWVRTLPLSWDVTSVLVDHGSPDTVYAATAADQDPRGFHWDVLRSTDAGQTWVELGSNLPDVTALVLEPSGRILHAATSLGVYDYELTPDARLPIVPPRNRAARILPPRP